MDIFSIPFLATAIAIVISWALFAIFCSLINECRAQFMAERGRFMQKYFLKQFDDRANGINWAALLYKHGSIRLLSRANHKPTNDIEPELFAKTIIEIVGDSHEVQTLIPNLKNAPVVHIDDQNPYRHAALYNFKAAVQVLKPSESVKLFNQMIKAAELQVKELTPENEPAIYQHLVDQLAKWQKEFNERLSLWYKKKTRTYLFSFGAIIALIANVDSIQLFNFYNENPESRKIVIDYYQKNADALSEFARKLNDSALLASKRKDSTAQDIFVTYAEAKRLKGNDIPDSAKWQRVTDSLLPKLLPYWQGDSLLLQSQKFLKDADSLQKLGNLPVGFDYSVFSHDARPQGGDWFWKILGILISGFAASFGAPFWFDLLKKVTTRQL